LKSVSQLYNQYFASKAVFSHREDERIFRTRFKRFWLCLFVVVLLISPFFLNEYYFYLLNLVLVNLISATGLNLLIGFTGLLSLGHAAFMGAGAYTAALLVTKLNVSLIPALLIAGLFTAALGIVIGIPSLRIKGFYLMVATLAFQFLMEYTIVHWESVTNGIRGIELEAPKIFGLSLARHESFFFFILAVCAFLLWGARNLLRSKLGRAFVAIRDNDVSAEIIGIPVFRYKLLSFAFSSFFAGVAGALYAMLHRNAIPDSYVFTKSIEYLVMVLVGGLGNLLGTIFGVLFITLVPEFINLTVSYLGKTFDPNLIIFLGPAKEVVFGLLIVLFIIFEPAGLVGIWIKVREYFRIWPLPYISE
jgi:branched-chain amino acid transport system permease protein